MLKIFGSKKHGKREKASEFNDTDTLENSQSRNTANLSVSGRSPLHGPGGAAHHSVPNSRSASVPNPVTYEDTTYEGNDRDSNYSCISGDSDSYVPRNASVGGLKPGVTLPQQQQDRPMRVDAPDVLLPAVRYVYNTTSHQWGYQYVRLRILHPNRGIAQDDFHVYFACDLLLLKSCPVRMPDRNVGDGTHAGAIATVSAADAEIVANTQRRASAAPTGTIPATVTSGKKMDTSDIYKVIPMVARMYRHDINDVTDADYFGAAQAQAVTEHLAYQFSRFPVAPGARSVPLPLLTNRNVCRIDYGSLPPELQSHSKGFFSYVTQDSRDILMVIEPDVRECGAVGISFSTLMPSTANSGSASVLGSEAVNGSGNGKRLNVRHEDDVYDPFDTTKYSKDDLKAVAEAFSHFTYAENKGKLMVHGLLCSHHYLVDPLVYTEDQQGFGMGNDGPKALKYWRDHHRCNDICRSYGLEPVNTLTPLPTPRPTNATADGKGGGRNGYTLEDIVAGAGGNQSVETNKKEKHHHRFGFRSGGDREEKPSKADNETTRKGKEKKNSEKSEKKSKK